MLPNKPISTAPLYQQIADDLRLKIFAEEWKPKEKIPPELQLCTIYRVSRITIRKAIDVLVHENLLYRERAKGTFVREYADYETEHFTLVKSFTKEMEELGKKAITLNAEVQVVPANKLLASYLHCKLGTELLELKRTRGADGTPFAYTVTYIPFDPRYSTNPSDYYGSFYDYLRTFGIVITKQKEYIESILPSPEIQEVLSVERHEPILKRVRIISNNDGSYQEYSENFYIGSKYRYYVDFG